MAIWATGWFLNGKIKKAMEESSRISPEDKQSAVLPEHEKFELLGKLISEEVKWMIADLKNLGVQISTSGILIKIDGNEASKLQMAVSNNSAVSVGTLDGKRFNFRPLDDGSYEVHEHGKPTNTKIMSPEYVEFLSNKLTGL